jgi:hypothetical protein
MGSGWYHPAFPLLAVAVGVGLRRESWKELLLSAAPVLAMLAAYFGIFLITPAPLQWHLDSALSRLLVQVWPLLLIAVFAGLRSMEPAPVAAPAAVVKGRKKARA